MRALNRREFLHASGGLAAALAGAGALEAAETKAAAKKAGANDQLHVAVVGVHGRGGSHVTDLAGKHDCVVTTICDADEAVIGPAMKLAEVQQGKAPRYEKDIRKVLEDKSIDLVTIATPNHWHALAAIWALQAGKHVYVEKPVSHNVSEGRRIVEVAEKTGRLCQTGTQNRSSGAYRAAMEFLHAGKLGKIKVARALCYKRRGSIGKVKEPQPVPKTVDYDLWTGPAPMKHVMRRSFHYDWHWQWDYGNGDLGNQGIHQMDVARWGLGKSELAQGVLSVGGRFGYIDDGETPNSQICVFDYGDTELIFEVRGLVTPPLKGASVGNIFHCEKGYLVCGEKGIAAFDHDGQVIQRFSGGGDHCGNFVQAVRNHKREQLTADILEGHLSSALCHLGNISYRLGTMQPFSKKTKAFGDDKEAYETLARLEEHLTTNKVPLAETSYMVGRKLAFDPKKERFIDCSEADTLLTREYRKGFVVPEKA
jgi:predicted dehydrogenase